MRTLEINHENSTPLPVTRSSEKDERLENDHGFQGPAPIDMPNQHQKEANKSTYRR